MAVISIFPQERNVGRARQVAAAWMGKHTQREREIYFRSICRNLSAMLQRIGFTETEAVRQTEAFGVAVQEQVALIDARTRQHAERRQVDFTEVHRVLDEGMAELAARGFGDDKSPGGAW